MKKPLYLCGYLLNNETAYFKYDFETESLSSEQGNSQNVSVVINNNEKVVTIELYIVPKTFNIEISKTSSVLENTLIENAKFSLEQPDIGDKKRDTISNKTTLNNKLVLSGEVAGQGGPYEYILKESTPPEGYENNNIQIKFNITFDQNGNITNFTHEEINSTKSNFVKDESNDYIASTEAKNYATIGTLTKNENIDTIPVNIENEPEKTNLEITVLNSKYQKVVIKDALVNVIGQNSNGKFYEKTLKTNQNGQINIARIDNTGDFDFSAIATKVPTGYLPQQSATTAYLNKNATTTELTQRIVSQNVTVEGNKISIKLYVEPQTFNIEISKYEQALGNLLIPNAVFSLKQPDITEGVPQSINNGVLEREVVTGTTKKYEKLNIKGEVAGQGTYEYTLKERAPSGYEDKQIEYTLKITFDENGNIQNIVVADDEKTTQSKSYVTLGNYTKNNIPISIMNYQKPYSVTVELTNTKYRDIFYHDKNGLHIIKGIKIENARVKIVGTANGSKVYEKELRTNKDGQVVFEPLTTRGDITYKIEVLEVHTGYLLPSSKTIEINKDEVTTEITLKNEVADVGIDNSNKDIHVDFFLDPQTFEIEINKKDKDEDDVLVAGAAFTVEQPNFSDVGRSDRSREILQGSTTLNTPLIITAEVGGKNSPYIYKITENTVPSGYTVDNRLTQIEVEFNQDGTVKNVNCLNDSLEAYIDNSRTNSSKVSVNIVNTKKPYAINVTAVNSEYQSIKVEGLKLKIIGKDQNGQKVYESEELTTDSNGRVRISELKTTGDVIYEIQQLEKAPAAYFIGNTKYVNLNINKQNNVITCSNAVDGDITVNDSSKEISVKLLIEPKKFTINISKLDYDDKLKDKDTLLGEVPFRLKDPRGPEKWETTKANEVLKMQAQVAGEGTHTYELWERHWADGYQEFFAQLFIKITFDENGDIIEQTITEAEEEKEPVELTYQWWTWGIDEKIGYHEYEVENDKGKIELTNYDKKSVDVYVTNVKKEYALYIRTMDDKYETSVDDVTLQVTAYSEDTNEKLFENTQTTKNGLISIAELRYIGNVRFEIKPLSIPTQYNDLNDMTLVIYKHFPESTIDINRTRTSEELNAKNGYPDPTKPVRGPINTPSWVNMTIWLNRKTFNINLTKVDIDNNNILLPGATFNLVQYDEKHTQTEKTNKDGELVLSADIDGIAEDSTENEKEYLYKLIENTAPSGYRTPTTQVQLYVTLNKKDEITNVRITNGSSFVSEITENRDKKNIDLQVTNSKGGNLYNLKLIKKYNDKEIEGSRYEIIIDAQSGENLTIKNFTDKNGQINESNIPGNGKMVFKLREIEPAEGYILDTTQKIVTASRDEATGNIEIIESETSSDVKATYDKSTNTICIEINTPKPKENSNIIRILSVDKNDETKAVAYATVQIFLPENQGVLEEITNSSGCINLNNVTSMPKGTYTYTLKVIQTPAGYLDFQGGDINVNITFDEEGHISDTALVTPNNYADGYYTKEENDQNYYNIANIIEKNTPKEIINLNLLKLGENEDKLKDVEFDIISATTIDGKETISKTSKKTDSKGNLNCEILSGDKVEITLKETKTQEAYKLDSAPKTIVLQKVGDTLEIVGSKTDDTIQTEFIENNLNVTVTNKYKPAKVIMQLLNEDSNGQVLKLAGIKVKLKEISSDREYEVTTDYAGEINFNDLPVEEDGRYQFVITEMSTIQGFEVPRVDEQNPITITVDYVRTEIGKLEVEGLEYSSTDNLVKGVSYTNYSAPEEYRLTLMVVLSEEISRDAKYNINIYKLDKDLKIDNNEEKYLQGASFEASTDYFNNTGISFEDITNEAGEISYTIPFVSGDMKVNIKETSAPEGYKLDDKEQRQIILNKDENGNVTINTDINSDTMYTTFDNSNLNVFVMNSKDQEKPNPDDPDDPNKEYNFELEIDKIEKETQKPIEGVEFKVTQINEETKEELEEGKTYTTDEEGKIKIQVNRAKAKGEYVYKIKETTPRGYKDVEEILIKVYIGEDGKVKNIELLEENTAVKETKVEENIAKVVVQNEKDPGNPDDPDDPNDPDNKYEFIIMLDKIDKQTKKAMSNIEFTITRIDENTGDEIGSKVKATTNEDGKLAIKINKVKAKHEYVYKIKETTPKGYKDVKEIIVKVYIREDGSVEKAELLEKNKAVKEIKVEDKIVKLTVENEKEDSNPSDNNTVNNNTINNATNNTTNSNTNNNVNTNTNNNTNNPNPGVQNRVGKDNTNTGNKKIGQAIKNAVSKIPYTGASYVIILLLITSTTIATISYIKYKNTK